MDETQKPKPLSEDYKKKLAECLVKNWNYTTERAYRRIAEYQTNLPGYLEESLEPELNAITIVNHF